MSLQPDRPDAESATRLAEVIGPFFDGEWYRTRYSDVASSGTDPLHHFANYGAAEGRDPNPFFDGAWYTTHYPDVAASGILPLLHYLDVGAAELRNPHPRFDAAYYVDQHPEAANNPLLHHLLFGVARGWLTEKPLAISDYMPSKAAAPTQPRDTVVDVIIPVYRGISETRRCILSVLADKQRPPGEIIVVDDKTPQPALARWLQQLAAEGRIRLLRNQRNEGFVASVNIGIRAAGDHDVVLLNSDTEVPSGWLQRLAGHAYATPRVASVSPFSNNATICSYPSVGDPAFGLTTNALDEACRTVNTGRTVDVPTTVGFCMYIRAAAIADVGLFDARAFGRGYGEENDFCLRASAHGWRHLLACDTYVHHEGSVSFGKQANAAAEAGLKVLNRRYPNYSRIVAQHVRLDAAGSSRFAVTLELFRRSGLPTILMLSHDLGGGVRRHVDELVARLDGQANVLLLQSTARGAALSVPALPGHPELALPAERLADLVLVLRSVNVTRAHIHHLIGIDFDPRELLQKLDVPFDLTVHDYFAICPQVNLLPWLQGAYCGEPPPALCNACIADRPSHGARDITDWRRRNAWQFLEAERVLCPSEDLRARLARHGLDRHAILAPHESVAAGPWPLKLPALAKDEALRIAVIGVLAQHKGALTVTMLAEAADPKDMVVHLIGYPEEALPPNVAKRMRITGEYKESELPALLAKAKPHVVWFPAHWPETFSYTLSAPIDAGLPIVAPRIGAFPERLAGRPLTWLADPELTTDEWLAIFRDVRAALTKKPPASVKRKPVIDYYADAYMQPPPRRSPGVVDLRRPDSLSIVLVPERFDNGALTPCGYIRLLQPLDHLATTHNWDIVVADHQQALRYRADVLLTQRYAIPDDAVDALTQHCRAQGMSLVYDLDDDLLHIPREHADAKTLRPRARVVSRLLRAADTVWASTAELAARLAATRKDVRVVANGLDERLWLASPPNPPPRQGPVRILFMGTATHDGDLALILPALERLKQAFGAHVAIELLGVSARSDLPAWLHRIEMPGTASASYPGFVNWITQQHWDIGLAPLADTPFNRCKSALKSLDYAALGVAILASERDVYRGSPASWLLPDDTAAWFAALSRLVRDGTLRRRQGESAHTAVAAHILAAQAPERRAALLAAAGRAHRPSLRPPRTRGEAIPIESTHKRLA
jgi:GT2 family glycosyltransferase/glycosyltransferase involved in cell wall biosynthesis